MSSRWHEHDAHELVTSVTECMEKAATSFIEQGHKISDIKSIGITNQRETTIVWDTETGEPLYNAIAWPDTRTKGLVRELKEREGADKLPEICGLPLTTYPSSVKLLWLLRNVDAVKKAYEEGRLSFGTVDTWLLYHLNGGKDNGFHVTDATNASRTMFMNLHNLQYDDKLLSFFELDAEKLKLPKIVPCSSPDAFGKVSSGQLAGVRITGCLGDQSAALVGQQGFATGSAKNTYGTGCFLLYNVGEEPVISKHGLLATIAYHFGADQKPVYALEGSIAVAGSGVKFLINNLGFVSHSHKVSELAATVEDNGGCVFVTAFSGLFAPYWIDDAKGTIFGITQHTQRGHIARATLEATCFQTKAILDAMEKDSGHQLAELKVDGGMSNSDLCMQVSRRAACVACFGASLALRSAQEWLMLTHPDPLHRLRRTSSVYPSTGLRCVRRPLSVLPSPPALRRVYGRISMSLRRSTRRIGRCSSRTSVERRVPNCSRSGAVRSRCVEVGSMPTKVVGISKLGFDIP